MKKKQLISKENIIIIGASGHAKVIIDIIEKCDLYNIVGFIDSYKPKESKLLNYSILGTEENILELSDKYNFKHAIIAIGDNWVRKKMQKKISNIFPDIIYSSVIHPNAILGRDVFIGKGTVVMAGVIVNSDTQIGDFCILNTNSSLGHDGEMKNFSSLAPNATLGGNVTIGNCTAISLGTNIIQGITIGKHSIIGAGSLVIRNIEDYTLSYGCPSKIIRKIQKGEKYLYNK